MRVKNTEPPVVSGGSIATVGPTSPAKALAVLHGARRVVDRDGADGLTLRAVAQESGVSTSLAIYYYGSMARLEALLLDSIWSKEVADHLQELKNLPASLANRVDILVRFHSTIAQNQDGFRTYSELITHVIRNANTREKVAKIYEGYRLDLNFPLLESSLRSCCETRALAALMLAIGEGLPLARLIDDSEEVMTECFALLAELFKNESEEHQVAIVSEQTTTGQATPGCLTSHFRQLRDNPEAHNTTPGRLLSAGIQLLHRGGLREITFSNISRVSGESKSLITYYFKSKQGFLEALGNRLLTNWSRGLHEGFFGRRTVTPTYLKDLLFGDESLLLSLLLLLPLLRQSPALRVQAKAVYLETIESISPLFEFPRPELDGYSSTAAATVFVAALHGLAVQSLYDPERFLLDDPLRLLKKMLPFMAVSSD